MIRKRVLHAAWPSGMIILGLALFLVLGTSSYTIGNNTKAKYQDTAAATANTINITEYADYSSMTERYALLNIFGSIDAAGDLDISTGVFDSASTTQLETGSQTAGGRGGSDAITKSGTQKGGTDACTNAAPSTTECTCATATFSTDLVAAGDIVINTTTGERAVVVSVDSETKLTTTAITSSWTAADDVDVYSPDATPTAVEATTATFVSDSVIAGDIVYNSTTGERAVVASIESETALTTSAITGGYLPDDVIYVGALAATTLTDSAATFETNLVYPGCFVRNLATLSVDRVESITSETALVVASGGDGFVVGETYEVIDPWTWTVIAGRTYGAVAAVNDNLDFPYAQGYRVTATAGGRLRVTYQER